MFSMRLCVKHDVSELTNFTTKLVLSSPLSDERNSFVLLPCDLTSVDDCMSTVDMLGSYLISPSAAR